MQREQRIISGKLLEANFYPIFADGRRMPRGPKLKKSTAAQEKYNRQKSVKRAIRDINTNFDTDDLFIHPTYAPADAPRTKEEAKRNIDNYRRRIETKRISELKRFEKLLSADPQNKEYRKRIRILKKPFRWYYRLEEVNYKSGPYAGRVNYHYHFFVTGGIDRDTIEDMWPYRINADRFRPDKFGAEAAARYATKPSEKENERVEIHHSRNLKKPRELKPKDGQISRRGVEKLARTRKEDKQYWENRYPGYTFIRCFPRYNEYNGHWYVTVLMYRYENEKASPPEWTISEWLDE